MSSGPKADAATRHDKESDMVATIGNETEVHTNSACARAVGHPDISPELRQVLSQNLADERRHRDWISRPLDRMQGHPLRRSDRSSS